MHGTQGAGLTLRAYAQAKGLDEAKLAAWGVEEIADWRGRRLRMSYRDASGAETAVRYRLALDDEPRFLWEKGAEISLYGLWLATAAREAGFVILVEGESDCHTLWQAGFPALGVPGAGAWDEARDAGAFDGIARIYAIDEGGKAGETLMRRLAQSPIAARVRVVRLGAAKDPSGLYLAGRAHFGDAMKAALDAGAALDELYPEADPLAGLLARVAGDATAAFQSDALKALARIKRRDAAAFEAWRAKLKASGVRVTALDAAVAAAGGGDGGRPSVADRLIELAATCELFHAGDGTAFASIEVEGHRETWPVLSRGFRHWLVRRFYEDSGTASAGEAVKAALTAIEARAQFEARVREVALRVAAHEGRLYLDLGDAAWRAVEIDAEGWRIEDVPPVRFRRASSTAALPEPERGGSIELLRPFLNVRGPHEFTIAVAWLLAALSGRAPYPPLVLSGEQGSAKSTFSAMLRALIDPSALELRALPREERDLFVAANNGYVLAFDNVSGLAPWMSDALCRLSSGAGFATRELYSDQSEVVFKGARPVILNGIEDVVARADLADRAVFLTLAPIGDEARQSEDELWAAFEGARAKILGVLLDAVSCGLRERATTKLPRLPRMADFALWASACEGALWPKGTFWRAYTANRDEAVEGVIEADAVACAVRAFVGRKDSGTTGTAGTTGTTSSRRKVWQGTSTLLLPELDQIVSETEKRTNAWPKSPNTLAKRLRRAATFLRHGGIDVAMSVEGTGRERTRTITICLLPSYERNESFQSFQPSHGEADLFRPGRVKPGIGDEPAEAPLNKEGAKGWSIGI